MIEFILYFIAATCWSWAICLLMSGIFNGKNWARDWKEQALFGAAFGFLFACVISVVGWPG